MPETITITCEELERRFILAVEKIVEIRQVVSVREGGKDHSPLEAIEILATGLTQVHSILVKGKIATDCYAKIETLDEARKGKALDS